MDRKGRNKQRKKFLAVSVLVWLYADLLQALKGERLSSVFSPDGTLISASAALHCGGRAVECLTKGTNMVQNIVHRSAAEGSKYGQKDKQITHQWSAR